MREEGWAVDTIRDGESRDVERLEGEEGWAVNTIRDGESRDVERLGDEERLEMERASFVVRSSAGKYFVQAL